VGTLDDKVAVIVGGTSGIGAAAARLFATEGAAVVIAGRRVGTGERLAAELGSRAIFCRADVTVDGDLEALMAYAVAEFGRIDCLVNSAGGGGTSWGITGFRLDGFMQTLGVHVGGVAAAIGHAAPIMTEQGTGSIINIASAGGLRAGWTQLDYSCAKAAVIHLTRCVAVELGEAGIRVNSISPGPILTGIFAKAAGVDPEEADRSAPSLEPVFAASLASWRPLARVGVPEDVAAAALWLASDASSLITGHDVPVDGGLTVGPPASVLADNRAELIRTLLAARGQRQGPGHAADSYASGQ
jgi:NAD(P)-dependent dehydrogenase (short-subunit alcohol dehydrogenase family)